ncbi:MAG: single-stranded DNA-binding protein [Acidothermales bacterium]|nr:single-stranded DNA-binding protein [Acidothermales bacterium]
MNDTVLTVVGNLASDVRYRVAPTGTRLASFRLAANSRRFDKAAGEWVDTGTSFYTVTCWRQLADHVRDSCTKGQPVIVVGRLRVRDWEHEGRSGTAVEIDALAVGHDLSRGIATFAKAERTGVAGGGEEAAAA